MTKVTNINTPLTTDTEKSKGTITKICLSCNKAFTVSTAKRRGPNKKYCSYRCRRDFHCKHVRTKDSQRLRVSEYYAEYPEMRFLASTKQPAKLKHITINLDTSWFKNA